jgi:hypothetical protein
MDICKYADDVWFFAMALKKGTQISKFFLPFLTEKTTS